MTKIKLTAFEVELSKILEIPLTVYARGKMDLGKERIKHEKWLQTPAGAAYMAKRRAAYEKKLARDRAYSKAYRMKRKTNQ